MEVGTLFSSSDVDRRRLVPSEAEASEDEDVGEDEDEDDASEPLVLEVVLFVSAFWRARVKGTTSCHSMSPIVRPDVVSFETYRCETPPNVTDPICSLYLALTEGEADAELEVVLDDCGGGASASPKTG